MFASVTRLRVRSVWFVPGFLWMTLRSQRQVVRAAGFVGGRLLVDRGLTFWTLTVWESEGAMKAFRGSGPHAKVMPKLVEWCNEAAYAHWNPAGASVPTWPEAYDHLTSEGKLSRVAHPSPDHEARRFPPPRLTPLIGQELKPAGKALV
jgi:Domain of unknown function (DUF3291)